MSVDEKTTLQDSSEEEGKVYVLDLTRAKKEAENDPELKKILNEYFARLEDDYDLSYDFKRRSEYQQNLLRIYELEQLLVAHGFENN